MGTLNDWFTSEGFAKYTVANGKLKSGDEIAVQHTCNPVSYTHLDVYKRQLVGRPMIQIPAVSPVRRASPGREMFSCT